MQEPVLKLGLRSSGTLKLSNCYGIAMLNYWWGAKTGGQVAFLRCTTNNLGATFYSLTFFDLDQKNLLHENVILQIQ